MIFNKIKKCFLDKKYLHIKNAINLESFNLNFNFDSMFHMLSMNNYLKVQGKKNYHTYQGLSMIGQILEVNKINVFKDYLNYIDKNLGNVFKPGNLDFFYSLKGEVGAAHIDSEYVIILGIKNITYYHIDNIDLKIKPGDVLCISKDILHHAFSSRERIVLSLSLWKK